MPREKIATRGACCLSLKTSGEKGCWELHDFITPKNPHSHGSWDKSKNPYPYWASAGARPHGSWTPLVASMGLLCKVGWEELFLIYSVVSIVYNKGIFSCMDMLHSNDGKYRGGNVVHMSVNVLLPIKKYASTCNMISMFIVFV